MAKRKRMTKDIRSSQQIDSRIIVDNGQSECDVLRTMELILLIRARQMWYILLL